MNISVTCAYQQTKSQERPAWVDWLAWVGRQWLGVLALLRSAGSTNLAFLSHLNLPCLVVQ